MEIRGIYLSIPGSVIMEIRGICQSPGSVIMEIRGDLPIPRELMGACGAYGVSGFSGPPGPDVPVSLIIRTRGQVPMGFDLPRPSLGFIFSEEFLGQMPFPKAGTPRFSGFSRIGASPPNPGDRSDLGHPRSDGLVGEEAGAAGFLIFLGELFAQGPWPVRGGISDLGQPWGSGFAPICRHGLFPQVLSPRGHPRKPVFCRLSR